MYTFKLWYLKHSSLHGHCIIIVNRSQNIWIDFNYIWLRISPETLTKTFQADYMLVSCHCYILCPCQNRSDPVTNVFTKKCNFKSKAEVSLARSLYSFLRLKYRTEWLIPIHNCTFVSFTVTSTSSLLVILQTDYHINRCTKSLQIPKG